MKLVKEIKTLFWALFFLIATQASSKAAPLQNYDRAKVREIQITGLKNTADQAVRLLLGAKPGEDFSSLQWEIGIQNLYNTFLFFDIRTEITESKEFTGQIDISLFVSERWAFLPLFQAQGGGNSTSIEIGARHSNLGGYFTRAILGINSFNGNLGYRVRLFQEWLLDTDFMFGLEASKTVYSTTLQDSPGSISQQYLWSRSLQHFALGKRFGQKVRVFSIFETYQDSILIGNPSLIYQTGQYRFRPTLILGRVNLSDYLEEGYEFTVVPYFANFLDPSTTYNQVLLKHKHVLVLPSQSTIAFLLSAGAMTSTLSPYHFRLGGFDRIRGFSTNRVIGSSLVSANLEYRPILFTHSFSQLGLGPIAFQGCLFMDAGWTGTSFGETPSQGLALASIGAGFRAIFVNFANSTLRFDLAQTVAPSEGLGFSFGIGQFF